ncbi:hypothetical protein MTO96_019397 [Rhipicephalus appendiculatus]
MGRVLYIQSRRVVLAPRGHSVHFDDVTIFRGHVVNFAGMIEVPDQLALQYIWCTLVHVITPAHSLWVCAVAVVIEAATGATGTAASVKSSGAEQAEEVAIALAIADPGCHTVLSDSRQAVRNFSKGQICREAERVLFGIWVLPRAWWPLSLADVTKHWKKMERMGYYFYGRISKQLKSFYGLAMNRVEPGSTGPQAATSHQREGTGCFVVRNFKPYCLSLRFFGCLFIEGLAEDSCRKARVTWKTPYTLYSLLWLSSMVYAESEYTAEAAHGMMVGEFAESVVAVLKMTIFTTAVANLVSAVLGTGRLLEFFRDCAEYEKSAKFRFPEARESLMPRWLVVLMRTVGLGSVVTACGILLSAHYGPRGPRAQWSVFSKVVGVAALAVSVCYEWAMYLTLVPSCEALAWYVRDQRRVFVESKGVAATSGTAAEEVSNFRYGTNAETGPTYGRIRARQFDPDKGTEGVHQRHMGSVARLGSGDHARGEMHGPASGY